MGLSASERLFFALGEQQTAMAEQLQRLTAANRAASAALELQRARLLELWELPGAEAGLRTHGLPLWRSLYVPTDVAVLFVLIAVGALAMASYATVARRRTAAKELLEVSHGLEEAKVDAAQALGRLEITVEVPPSPMATAPPTPSRRPCHTRRGDHFHPLDYEEEGVRHRENVLRRPLQAGDIILCQTKNLAGRLQRAFTSQTWDHVCIVVTGGSGRSRRRYLFEATSEGVTLAALMPALKVYREHSHRLVIRQLETESAAQAQVNERLREFVLENAGKPYEFFSPRKAIARKIWGRPQHEDSYFCSELIACCLRHMGVLKPTVKTNQFWPGSFGNGGEVEKSLCPGVTLGQAVNLDCCVYDQLARTTR